MRSLFVVPAMLLVVGSVARGQGPAPVRADPATTGYDSVVAVPAGTRIFAQLQRPLDTRLARPGDTVYLQVTFPVTVANSVAIPAGTYVLATIDSVARSGFIHHRIAFRLRVASLVFANGYVAAVSEPAHAQPRDPTELGPGEAPKALLVAGGAAPVAGLAIGALVDGERGALIGSGIGGAVGLVTSIVAFTRAGDYALAPGFSLELRSEGTISLDADRTADAARMPANVQQHLRAAQRRCFTPGTPGTPDVVIPGTPAIPPMGDSPGTPGTPDTIIPGTPGTPGSWHACP